MAIPSSGSVSFGNIAGEMGLSAANSLSYLSQYAGNSTGFIPSGLTSSPYGMGEFRGFSFQSGTYTQVYTFYNDPCGSPIYLWYYTGNGLYYDSPGGSLFYGYGYQYGYYDSWSYEHYWYVYYFSAGTPVYQYATTSYCAGLQGPGEF